MVEGGGLHPWATWAPTLEEGGSRRALEPWCGGWAPGSTAQVDGEGRWPRGSDAPASGASHGSRGLVAAGLTPESTHCSQPVPGLFAFRKVTWKPLPGAWCPWPCTDPCHQRGEGQDRSVAASSVTLRCLHKSKPEDEGPGPLCVPRLALRRLRG